MTSLPTQQAVADDLNLLLDALPPHVIKVLKQEPDIGSLLEIVMDLGRLPAARFLNRELALDTQEVTLEDLAYVTGRIGEFGQDNRAGIERTLHRISAIRNRKGKVVGITCRVGRAIFGTIKVIEDLVSSGKSVLILGRPGVGKTTMLREVARVLADQYTKRVVIVDTSNEIAGDGDIPHPGIGKARRMQVPTPSLQHEVMIEAVENHMPEVVVIDEIGREAEALAARTIAERGVQLIATAHGTSLENLMMNPTLADLIGGIQSVTLGDEEARRRGTQKSILERKAPPTFDSLVDILAWNRVAVHEDVAATVDALLRGQAAPPEIRWLDEAGAVQRMEGEAQELRAPSMAVRDHEEEDWRREREPRRQEHHFNGGPKLKVYPYGVNRGRAEQVIRATGLPVEVTGDARRADAIMTTKAQYRNRPQAVRIAEESMIPVVVLRKNTSNQIEDALISLLDARVRKGTEHDETAADPVNEAEAAVKRLLEGEEETVELSPQNSYIRRIQHQVAEKNQLLSRSTGKEPFRRVRLFRTGRQ
ncbi:MAG: AAA family ATPase [Chloroflexi bacterium]|nr:AAA family ATPase [Chloroflexota bacterium]